MGRDERLERALSKLPAHMRDDVQMWIVEGLPHPTLLGSFFRAVLLNDLVEAVAHGDDENVQALREWAVFLYNDMPGNAWRTAEALNEWHTVGGLNGIARAVADAAKEGA